MDRPAGIPSLYDGDPRVEVYDPRNFDNFPVYAVTNAAGVHLVHLDIDRPGLWVLSPATAPREARHDGVAYMAWNATLPRYLSLDAAIAAVLGAPRAGNKETT